jgi:hypothetical protein
MSFIIQPAAASITPGMTLVSTLTASFSTSLEWTGLSGINAYMLVLNKITGSTTQFVSLVFGTGSTTYVTSGYAGGTMFYSTITGFNGVTNNSTSINLHKQNGNTPGISGSFFLTNMLGDDPAATGTAYGGTATNSVSTISGSVNTTGPFTAVKLFMNGGNLDSGKASLYQLIA